MKPNYSRIRSIDALTLKYSAHWQAGRSLRKGRDPCRISPILLNRAKRPRWSSSRTASRRAELWLAHKVRPMFEERVLPVTEDVMFKWRLLVEEGRKAGHTLS